MEIANFHDVRFPEDISYGSSGGPGFNTSVIDLASGHEQRNINWSLARAKYDASYGVKTREQMEEVLDFFYARRGKAFGFRFKDWMDFVLERQSIGAAGGTNTLQVFKRYEPLTSYFYDRPILKIVPGTVQVWTNGVERSPLLVNTGTGLVNTTGYAGQTIEVACEFDVPVRFDTDEINITHDDWELMSWPSIPLIELRPR
jgi:uncharacterized protein (TIGR02217 family)